MLPCPTVTRSSLIVLDLDGTLLNARGAISPRNAKAIAAAEAAGVPVVVATGRSWYECREVLAPIGMGRAMVTAGGSVLSDGPTGRTLIRHGMARPVVEETVSSLTRHGHPVLLLKDAPAERDHYVVVGEGPLDRASEWWFNVHRIRYARVRDLSEDPHPEDTVRVGVVATGATLGLIADELSRDVGDRIMLQHWSAVTEEQATGSSTHLLEVFDPRVSKWSMVRELCAVEGLAVDRVVAIGDGLNDVELLARAAVGIATANAIPQVRDVANAFTAHHDEDGVAEAIERLLAGEFEALLE